ncbi:MAG TPA: hypothetical protein VJ932_11275 [Alkalispirochaeta sp.]|nr:hypothetical protein [Alkalispirochaeta sp.]
MNGIRTGVVIFLLVVGATTIVTAEEPVADEMASNDQGIDDTGPQFVPAAQYDVLVTDEQTVHSPSGGLIVLHNENMFVGLYGRPIITRDIDADHPDRYHTIDLLYDRRRGGHHSVSLFSSESDEPVAGGWQTFQAASVWGYEVYQRPQTSIVVGGGLAVSDFGIELDNGTTWPVIPVPFLRIHHASPVLEASLDFITGPNLNVVLAPERDLQFTADVRIDQFRDLRDLIFETAVKYRFLAAGIKNDTFGFAPADQDDPVEVHYLAAFGTLDLGILKISGGYACAGRRRGGESDTTSLGDGFFLSIQAFLPL